MYSLSDGWEAKNLGIAQLNRGKRDGRLGQTECELKSQDRGEEKRSVVFLFSSLDTKGAEWSTMYCSHLCPKKKIIGRVNGEPTGEGEKNSFKRVTTAQEKKKKAR